MTALADRYHRALHEPSPMNEHCPTLRLLASLCHACTEIGVFQGVSTAALLMGQPGRLTSYDIEIRPEAEQLRECAGRTQFALVQGSSLEIEIDPTDLLFIDTIHTCGQLSAELARHAGKVQRWIVLHDTVTFGEHGEDKSRGLLPALREFLAAHPEWSLATEYFNGHGLTILNRLHD